MSRDIHHIQIFPEFTYTLPHLVISLALTLRQYFVHIGDLVTRRYKTLIS